MILKTNKSSSDLPPEVFKLNTKEMIRQLHQLFIIIWETIKIPNAFSHSKPTTIWKKREKRTDPSNYRGIQVGSIVCKIFVILLINRIQEWYNSQILDFQNGFRSGRSN